MPVDHADADHAGAIHHLELATSDLDRATPFWEWLLSALGYTRKNDWATGRSWIADPTYVVLVAAPNTDQPYDHTTPGLDHVAFHAPARATVDTLTDGVRQRSDATLLYDDQHPYAGGYYALYCRGPDGIKVEVVAPEPEPDQ